MSLGVASPASGASARRARPDAGSLPHVLRLPEPAGRAPVDDSDFAACERVARAIDAAVAGWLEGRAADRLFVTLATPDFAPGLSVLVRSLRAVSDVPVLVMTQGDPPPDIAAPDIALLEVPPLLRAGHAFHAGGEHLAVTLSKLWVFSLTRPRRVAFIDADCLVLQPIDDLFAGDGFAAAPDLFADYETRAFNSGVFAFTPSAAVRGDLFRRLPTLPVGDGDQGVLNRFFRDWRQLPLGFNFLRAHALLRAEARDRALRIVHYTPAKPWRPQPASPRDPLLAPLDDLWAARLTPGEHLALVRDWRRRLATTEANIAAWLDGGGGLERRRYQRRLRRWLVAMTAAQFLQAGLLAWIVLR